MAIIRRGCGVKEAATRAVVIGLFPATACSLWQDALYPRRFEVLHFDRTWRRDERAHPVIYIFRGIQDFWVASCSLRSLAPIVRPANA
jgi:hypothetical protein